MKIGFIGVGKMGSLMAGRLKDAGYDLVLHDINKDAARALLDGGVGWLDSPGAVAGACEVVITMLPGPADIEQVVFGDKGLMTGWKKGDTYIDMSTSLPGVTRKVAAAAAPKGVAVVDAPVTGGTPGAEAGTLTIMVGAPEEAFRRVSPILEHMGKKVFHMGEVGCGHTTKLVNNIISLTCAMVNAEAFVLGVKSGVDTRRLWEAVTSGAGNNFQLENVWPRTILKGNFEPGGFDLGLAYKDLALATSLGREHGIPLPVSTLVEQCFLEARASGLGDKPASVIIWRLEELAGVKVRF